MSFLDELHNASANKSKNENQEKKRKEQEMLKDWNYFATVWMKHIKNGCLYSAKQGENERFFRLQSFIYNYFEKNYTSESTYYGDSVPKENLIIDVSYEEGKFWAKMRNHFYQWRYGEPEHNANWIKNYPIVPGMCYEEAVVLEEIIRKRIEKEKLKVESKVVEYQTLQKYETVYREFGRLEKCLLEEMEIILKNWLLE